MRLHCILAEILAAGLSQAGAQTAAPALQAVSRPTTTLAPGIGQRRRRQMSDGCQTPAARECLVVWLDLLDTFSDYVWNGGTSINVGSGRVAGADCDSIKAGLETFRQCMALEGCCEQVFEKKTIAEYLVNISADILLETTRKRDLCKFTTLCGDDSLPGKCECSAPDYTALVIVIIIVGACLVTNFGAFFIHRRVKHLHAPEPPELGLISLVLFIIAPLACCFPVDRPGSEIITSMRAKALGEGNRFEAQGLALPGHWGWGNFEKYGPEGEGKTAAASQAPQQHPVMAMADDGDTETSSQSSSSRNAQIAAEAKAAKEEYQANFQKKRQLASSVAARAFYDRKEYEAKKAEDPEAVREREAEEAYRRFSSRLSMSMQSVPGQLP